MIDEDVLLALNDVEEICREGGEVRWSEFLSRVGVDKQLDFLIPAMGIAFEYQNWSMSWLIQTLKETVEFSEPGRQRLILRELYRDTIETNRCTSWTEWKKCGWTAEKLDLRDDSDPVYLGFVVGGKYVLEERIGAGGFGVVFRAREIRTGQAVAIKGPLCRSPERTARAVSLIREEATLLRKVHSGVPTFVELCESDDFAYLVMEFVEGQPLSNVIEAKAVLVKDALQIVAKIADVIDQLHSCGIVHRDVKPENIFLRPNGSPCVLDFGIALSDETQFSGTQAAVGTLGFVAPEQLLGLTSQLDGRTDVFSLGGIFYSLLTRRNLFEGEKGEDWLVRLLTVRDSDFPPDLPEAVQAICLKCLKREPNERFNTAAELAATIRGIISTDEQQFTTLSTRDPIGLTGWRMGIQLGGALENLAYFRRELKVARDSGVQDIIKMRRQVATGLGFGFGAVIGFQDFTKLASAAGLCPSPFPHDESIATWFYRQSRLTPEECAQIHEAAERMVGHLEEQYVVALSALQTYTIQAGILFELAVKIVLVQLNADVLNEIRILAQLAKLPDNVWSQFFSAAENGIRGSALKMELDRFNKRLEQHLLRHESSAVRDGEESPSN